MFIKTVETTPSKLDLLIDKLQKLMLEMKPTDAEYKTMLEHLAELESIRKDNRPERISVDAKATIIANITGILLIMSHERMHVITTKAMTLLTKLR